jgi:hypothetical protein
VIVVLVTLTALKPYAPKNSHYTSDSISSTPNNNTLINLTNLITLTPIVILATVTLVTLLSFVFALLKVSYYLCYRFTHSLLGRSSRHGGRGGFLRLIRFIKVID